MMIMYKNGLKMYTAENLQKYESRFYLEEKSKDELQVELPYISDMIGVFTTMTRYSKLELKNYFSIEEALLICDCLNGMFPQRGYPTRSIVIAEIEDSIRYNKCDLKWEVSKDVIIEKLHKLTEFQCFVLLAMVFDFFNLPRVSFNNEDVKRIFLIE